jgi:molecular chaperone GrpE
VDDTEETPEPDIHEQLEEAQQRALRHQAELENFRKRMRREMEDQQRYSAIPLIRDLLPALDNLRRAVESAEPTEANDGVLSGVRMVCEQFEGILAKYQCCRIESEGAVFDPNLHEAVVQQPSVEHEAGTVIQEIQAGYRLLDRIVRPSQVMVAQSVEEQPEDKPGTPENEET